MAGRPGGKLEIALREAGEYVELTVRDHGPGIPADVLAQVFDPFFTTKEVGKGLGLGLSISYNIVKDFDGGLVAANHPAGGGEFTLTCRATGRRADAGTPNREAAE